MESKKSTVDPREVEQFSRIAEEWWDPHGKFKPLHDINPVRVEWILERVQGSGIRNQKQESSPTPDPRTLSSLRLLDIGCGGGLICEPMARLGAHVTGIDASEKNIAVAKLHAKRSGLDINYRCTTAEALVNESWVMGHGSNTSLTTHDSKPMTYDVVLALEIVEHVSDVELFVKSCAHLVKPGGLIIMSTLNRTLKSYAMAIVGAEYVLRLLPRGTHDWNRFLKPHELCRKLMKYDIEIVDMTGLAMNPLSWTWELSPKDLGVNYMVCGIKK